MAISSCAGDTPNAANPVTFQRSYGGAPDQPWTELNYRVYRAHMALLESSSARLERLFLIDNDGEIYANGLFRHRLSSRSLREGGHVGYEVPPRKRGRGYGKLFLQLALARAKEKGFGRVLITCNEENGRSRRILEAAGIPATVRKRKGADIDAACGQLRLKHEGPATVELSVPV